jgi:molybdate transport system ATP-binding protein
VALGRALLANSSWLLLDEPLTNLDQQARKQIVRFVNDWRKQRQINVIYVTHDIPEALALADQVITLADAQIVKAGRPDVLLGYEDAEQDLGSVLSARFTQHHKDDKLSELLLEGNRLLVPEIAITDDSNPLYLQIAAKDVSLALVRPERSSILNLLPCSVGAIDLSTEASASITLNLGAQQLLAKITRRSVRELDLRVGQEVWAQVKGVSLQT